jgi:hypothetical protein
MVTYSSAIGGFVIGSSPIGASNSTSSAVPFPPALPPNLQKIIASYLYTEYNDDDDLQAFVAAYNSYAQSYLTTANSLDLSIYNNAMVTGKLLDWVALGLYGISRPSLEAARLIQVGALNTYPFDFIPLNAIETLDPFGVLPQYYATSDDTFRRVITWHYFKGDGKVFNIRWLKRRVARFLFGPDGTNPSTDQTYRISVTFGPNHGVNLRIINNIRTVTSGSIVNTFSLNSMALNEIYSTNVVYPLIPEGKIFKEAVDSGVLELPFQFTFNINVS